MEGVLASKTGGIPARLLTAAQRRSLRQLYWMIAACIALPLLLFAYEGYTTYQTTRANADLEIARTRDIAREHAVKVFETIERSLSEIGEIVRNQSDDDLRANEQAFHDRLALIDEALLQMKSAWVLDAQGRALTTSLVTPAPPTSFADRDYFAAHRDHNIGTFIGRVLVPRAPFGGQPFFSMSRRRASKDGQFNGVLQASILPDYFAQFYEQIGFEPGTLLALVLADGRILASKPGFAVDAQISPGGKFLAMITAMPDAGLVTTRFSLDGVERRLAYQKLQGYPVYILAGLSTDAIFARWMREFEGLLFITVPGTLLLCAILWLYLQNTKRLYMESASRERAEAALRENQRLEALGQLTGGVAHDFNNLLTIIGSSADLLRRSTLSEERRLRYIDAIAETVARATALTAQLLAFARRQPMRPDVFDARQRVESMAAMLQTLVGSSVQIQIPRAPMTCPVETDVSQFETAIINLAANARDAMPNGGTLTIMTHLADRLPERISMPSATGRHVSIAVTDTGRGIPADEISRIFEPFFTTKDVGRGTGLGLSQVFGFVKQSKGEIIVDSTPGQGATFTMFLPFASGKVVSTLPRETVTPQTTGDGLRVLLVDDNEGILEATGDALRAKGFAVVTAGTGEAALTRLAAARERVDVVLTDIVMPGMSGLDLAKELHTRRPDLPVVVTTGYSETIEQHGEGDLILLRKPYSIDELVARLIASARQVERV